MTSPRDAGNATQDENALDPAAICSLPPADLDARLAWVRAEILPHAVSRHELVNGLAWELDEAPGLGDRLDLLVAAEKECCSGIDFEHLASTAPGRRRLEVRGVDPKAAIFAAGDVARPPAPTRLRRAAQALGLGTAASLFVCCVLPIAAVAWLGAAAAAPFTALDDPWIIAGAALLAGSGAYLWQGRKRAASSTPEAAGTTCGTDC